MRPEAAIGLKKPLGSLMRQSEFSFPIPQAADGRDLWDPEPRWAAGLRPWPFWSSLGFEINQAVY